MAEPGSLSAAIAQLTTTSGLDTYTLGMPIRDKLPVSAAYLDGDTFRYHVTDTSGTQEVSEGVFTAPDTLSRDVLVISSTGDFIDWPTSGQRVITPIVRFPICDTPPEVGQVLEWDGTEWCPADITIPDVPLGFAVCDTLPAAGDILAWNGTEWCPANLCALVDACLNPPQFTGCTWFWTQQSNAPGPFQWYGMTLSDDGTAMAVFEASSPAIIVTTDSGATWTDVTPGGLTLGNPFIVPIAADSTGQILLVAPGGSRAGLYLSSNAGASWAAKTLTDGFNGQGNEGGFSVAMSADGTKMIAGACNFAHIGDPGPIHVWVSIDSGTTWVEQSALVSAGGNTTWNVFMARDGTAFIAINGDRAFVSLDGSTWTLMTNPFSPDQFHATATMTTNAGVILVAHNLTSDFIYKSVDQGSTWTTITTLGPTFFGGNSVGATLSMSLDGQVIAAATQNSEDPTVGPLYVSCDAGVTWSASFTGSPPVQGYWNNIFVTGSGDRMAAITQGPFNTYPYSAERM